MIKINEVYIHEATGIEFNVSFAHGEQVICTDALCSRDCNRHGPAKRVVITPSNHSGWSNGSKGFVFQGSKPEMISKVGRALTEIGEFVEKL